MQPSKLFTALCFFMLLTACGVEPDSRVYGTWTEELTGQTIEFRQDGSLSWFGHEGSFAFKKSTNWASCIGIGGCPDGQVALDVDGQSFRISYYSARFDEKPNTWYLSFRSFSAMPQEVIVDGKTTHGFLVRRNGPTTPLTVPGFERMDHGIDSLHPHVDNIQTYNGEAVAVIDSALRRFDSQSGTWVVVRDEFSSWDYYLDPEVIHSYDDYSIDGGNTWHEMPFLDGDNHEGDIVAMGTTLYATVRIDVNDTPLRRETWRVNLSESNPSWERIGHTAATDYFGRQIAVITAFDTLVRWVREGDWFEVEISYDFGASWMVMENDCQGSLKAHADGVYCRAVDDSVQWYSLTTNTWTNIDVPYEKTMAASDNAGEGVYMVRNARLVSLAADGSETLVVELPASIGDYNRFFILDDQLIFTHLTLWRQFR